MSFQYYLPIFLILTSFLLAVPFLVYRFCRSVYSRFPCPQCGKVCNFGFRVEEITLCQCSGCSHEFSQETLQKIRHREIPVFFLWATFLTVVCLLITVLRAVTPNTHASNYAVSLYLFFLTFFYYSGAALSYVFGRLLQTQKNELSKRNDQTSVNVRAQKFRSLSGFFCHLLLVLIFLIVTFCLILFLFQPSQFFITI